MMKGLFFAWCGVVLIFSSAAAQDNVMVFDTIMHRVYADLRETRGDGMEVHRELAAMRSDGSWDDIDYMNKGITSWPPEMHLKRMQDLVDWYVREGKPDAGFYHGIVSGLRYWYKMDPKSSNWWHNEIKVPQVLGQLLIMLRYAPERIPADLEDSLLHRMKRGDIIKMTGANKLDIAIHFLYRAVLTKNGSLLDTAVAQAFQPLNFTTEEGLQYDYSYLQHGPQLQVSSYGAVFLEGEYKMAGYVRGTAYAVSGPALQRLSRYYADTYLRTVRGSYIDFNLEGRGISRQNILNKQGEKGLLGQALLVDPAHGMDWYAAMARTSGAQGPGYMVKPAHMHFWRGDYTLHVRPSYSFNVRMVSRRTRRTEMGNKEDIYGRYLPDGSTNIQRKGDEYYNIMPVWEWDKIPGVTAADHEVDKPMDKSWGEPGSTVFAGGVSDGPYGASAYVMDYDGVTAKKSWFFFDKEVVCLGAGIGSGGSEDISTTVNQCWLRGGVLTGATNGGKDAVMKVEADKVSGLTDPKWVWHDSVGYFFPEGGKIVVSTERQKGDWYHINNSGSKHEVSGKVFKMWLDHGAQPANGKYAYIVVPGSADDMKTYSPDQVRIIAHSDSLQAVLHPGLGMLQVIFFKAGLLSYDGISIRVDHPCAILLKHIDSTNLSGSLADPSQEARSIVVEVRTPALGRVQRRVCDLPQGVNAGASVPFVPDAAASPDRVASSGAISFIQENFSFAERQLTGMLGAADKNDTLFPRSGDKTGKMISTGMHDWTGGFFPGSLWYVYEYTKDQRLKEAAAEWTKKLAPMQFFTGHHDLGFLLYNSYGNAYRLTGDTSYAQVLVQAAKSLATRYDPKVGLIKSWNSFTSWHGGAPYTYPVIIDNMMNLELLFFASRFTGDPYYREIAVKHAENTMKNQVRADYSCYHVVCYDSATGAVLSRETAQGYADNSAWSRGQAWAIYGFTVAYRETRDLRFLQTARKMADFYLNHKNLPEDKVAYWDFNVNEAGYAPGIHSKVRAGGEALLRDASAAAIVAAALFELSSYLGEAGRPYYDNAVKILHSLAGPSYRADPGSNAHFLLKHSVGSIPHGFEIDAPLIYADYYFLEALERYVDFSSAGR